jgi:transposase
LLDFSHIQADKQLLNKYNMATVKIKFRASLAQGKEGFLYYQVIHRRMARQIRTGYRLYSTEWDEWHSTVVMSSEAGTPRHEYLTRLKEKLASDVRRLKGVIATLEQDSGEYTAEQVVRLYATQPVVNFVAFARELIGQLEQMGRKRTAATYSTAVNSFVRFRGDSGDIALEDMDAVLVMAYESHLKVLGLCPNSTSYYMRNLRALYNRAVEKELVVQRYPFKRVYTGIDKTAKRAVSLKAIRRIRDMDFTREPLLDYARDLFMFSFYTRGMSFVDIAFLKKSDLRNGVLSYRRRKTNQHLSIRWEAPMQQLINKYDTSGTPYLLPVIRDNETEAWRQYTNASHLVNRKLKLIGHRLGLSIPLTTYVARHAWASIAQSKNVALSVISEAMGHDSETTTRIYLATLDTSLVDKANRLVLRSL